LRLPLLVEAPVYGWERLVLLKHLLDQGLSKAAIARQLGVSRRSVYHWITTGQLERDLTGSGPRIRVTRSTQLEPYRPIITTRLGTYPELSAVRLFEEVRAAGYPGGITQLRDYVAQVRPRPEPEPLIRFETPPGHQAQVDFATCRFPWGTRFALLVVLGYSRLLWLRFYPRQTMATVIDGLEAAFTFFGGVPHELLFDQMKSVILEDHRPDGGKLLENAEFLRFAAHWGFRIRACRPYRAKTKGKVERPIGYVRGNLLYGRDFLGDADLDARTEHWLEHTANARIHGTTRWVPRAHFEQAERAMLLPLALRPYRALLPLPPSRALSAALSSRTRPLVTVERRPLGAYAALAEASV
jgi:transposase